MMLKMALDTIGEFLTVSVLKSSSNNNFLLNEKQPIAIKSSPFFKKNCIP